MYRGSTPIIKVKVNTSLSLDNLANAWLTFRPTASNEITFELNDMIIDEEEKTISIKTTQEDTLALTEGLCKVQLRLLKQNGMAYVSKKAEIDVNGILKEGVIE